MDTSSSSDEEIIFLSALAEEEEREIRKRKTWIHPINEKREVYGEFHHLFPDLLEHKTKFFKYFRMSKEKFFELHQLLAPEIKKENTNFVDPLLQKNGSLLV